ncbi:DsbA family protein [Bifidobacterium bombi]|uniref:Putative thioredoxin domain-containing protein n=1 Tax=Bifidobacterium bombi DSM 19703 TaxID=1341695 RepID=A0A086BPL0_9BIFI|nr:DsbA family protein [Bifidobacterium bombi]KFF31874.1 putative thioredoxin domain-containing protein [Bifidobacterium bombi DSM 19703]
MESGAERGAYTARRYVRNQDAKLVQPSDVAVGSDRRYMDARSRESLHHRRKARERKWRRRIIIMTLAASIVLICTIGVSLQQIFEQRQLQRSITEQDAYNALQEVKVVPEYADKKGGIMLSRNGYGSQINGVPTVEVFMDPLCPGCKLFLQQMDGTLETMVAAGQINLSVHPVAFLDRLSTDDYSSRTAEAIAYITDHDSNSEHLMNFLQNIYSSDFMPRELPDYKPVSNDSLRDQAIKAGVPEPVARKAFSGEFKEWVDRSNDYTKRRKDLMAKSGKFAGRVATPSIVCNGQLVDINKLADEGLSYKDAVLQTVGLTDGQVGGSDQLPSVGGESR